MHPGPLSLPWILHAPLSVPLNTLITVIVLLPAPATTSIRPVCSPSLACPGHATTSTYAVLPPYRHPPACPWLRAGGRHPEGFIRARPIPLCGRQDASPTPIYYAVYNYVGLHWVSVTARILLIGNFIISQFSEVLLSCIEGHS
jgi:hypothetical protein